MGLLDDAIREHLELKRLRGADADELAKVEREALEPVVPDDASTWGTEPGVQEPVGDEAGVPGDAAPVAPSPAEPHAEVPPDAASEAADFSHVGQETAEIDMEAVLNGDAGSGHEDHAAGGGPEHKAAHEASSDDSFEWEMPGEEDDELAEAADPPPEPIPGQERLSFE